MKKSLFYAVIAAAAMSSCSSDDVLSFTQQQEAEAQAQGLEPINLSLNAATASVSATRGTGTVGDTIDASNTFQYEDIYVLMMDVTPGREWSYTDCGGVLGKQFDNTFFCRPQLEGTNYSLLYNGFEGASRSLKYYPMHGSSDFFGYYVDDAADVTNAEVTTTGITLPFAIDGTQDIMAGKATNYSDTIGFSNTTARKGTVPVISMNHLLTRFTFEVIAGDDGRDSLFIDSISVTSYNKGTLTVAKPGVEYKEDGVTPTYKVDSLIAWDESTDTVMVLKKKSGIAATLADGKSKVVPMDTLFIGANGEHYGQNGDLWDAIFVQPGKISYDLKIKLHQWVKTANGIEELSQDQNLTIKFSGDDAGKVFERGHSYHIRIKVYGMREIKIETELEKWETGGNIDVETDY